MNKTSNIGINNVHFVAIGVIVQVLFLYSLAGQHDDSVTLLGHLDKKHGTIELGRPSFVTYSYSSCWGYAAEDGREYALLGVIEGTSVIDITDPDDLEEVAFIPGPRSIYREMKTYSHYAFIVSEGGWGLQIVDLSPLPDSVRFIKNWTYEDFDRAHTISQAGPYLYLNGGNASENGGIAIISVNDPENPVKVGEWTLHYVHDTHIRNDTIYAAGIYGDGLSIIDSQDKSNPQLIVQITYPGAGTHNAWTTEDGNYVLTTDEIGATDKNLKIWDIRDLDNFNLVAEFTPNDSAIVHNVYVRGNYAHVAWYTEGYVVVDITNPEHPKLTGSYNTYERWQKMNTKQIAKEPMRDLSDQMHLFSGAWNVYPYFPSGRIIVSDTRTGLYVFWFEEPVTSISERDQHNHIDFNLNQNYPNPFNPSTVIGFRLPVSGLVKLKIYNVLGEKVAILVNEELMPGSYEVTWDASGFAAGVYFYRLTAGDFTKTNKLILVK